MPQRITVNVDRTPGARSAPAFLTRPQTIFSLRPGATAILNCPGVGNPIPKAVWSRPDIPNFNNRTKILSYGLQIVDVTPEDRGMYVCRLDNGIAPALVHTVRLEILEAPEIIRSPQDTLKNEGERLDLECLAKGSPTPEIYWLINGADARWDSAIETNQSRLLIRSVEKKHAGIVQCFARNEIGEVSDSKLLQVQPKQIAGEISGQTLGGTFPQSTRSNFISNTGKPPKGRKKHKHRKFYFQFLSQEKRCFLLFNLLFTF